MKNDAWNDDHDVLCVEHVAPPLPCDNHLPQMWTVEPHVAKPYPSESEAPKALAKLLLQLGRKKCNVSSDDTLKELALLLAVSWKRKSEPTLRISSLAPFTDTTDRGENDCVENCQVAVETSCKGVLVVIREAHTFRTVGLAFSGIDKVVRAESRSETTRKDLHGMVSIPEKRRSQRFNGKTNIIDNWYGLVTQHYVELSAEMSCISLRRGLKPHLPDVLQLAKALVVALLECIDENIRLKWPLANVAKRLIRSRYSLVRVSHYDHPDSCNCNKLRGRPIGATIRAGYANTRTPPTMTAFAKNAIVNPVLTVIGQQLYRGRS
ncbi:hypothetical protein TELCIR_09377 [Teladorsagia circumcincta]|uniref:Uncharacterized protein n=1 Tax=Teladorsagia circumcincta TaxID=45464 RepID=A0A2G9UF21_TELCI|nr:hypothetical protein TELCIR_09377 [Teladorsagia circumcincta]